MDDFYGGDELADMKYLPLFYSYTDTLSVLTDEQLGRVIRAALAYMQSGTEPQLEPIEALAFGIIKKDAERSAGKYEAMCEKNRQNVQKRWESKKQSDTTVYDGIRPYTSEYETIPTDTKNTKDKGKRIKDKGKTSSNDVSAESSEESSTPPDTDEIICALILNDSTLYHLTESMAEQYEKLYPAVDVRQEFRNMAGWCDVNPMKRKTRGGVKRFVVNWLAREQNRGRLVPVQNQNQGFVPPPDDYPF